MALYVAVVPHLCYANFIPMGTLYLVATPIGNLEDITLRGLRILREVSLIAAEDTRHTRRLLAHYEISTPCISYHEHNKLARLDTIMEALKGGDIALVSDAGTPALSDPGYELVAACVAAGVTISPLPGPGAPTAALVASGLPTDRFFYLGFLPRRSKERQALFAELADFPSTLVCFETPHRLVAALSDALEVLGNRRVVAAREITKLHEEFVRLRIEEALRHFEEHPPRGEFTLVIAGAAASSAAWGEEETSKEPAPPDEAAILRRMEELHAQGERSSSAARLVAKEMGVPRSMVYSLWLTTRNNEE